MCYRKDLFKKAGLPTEREKVSELWSTWDQFLETGKKFQEKVPDTKWLDGPTAVFRATVLQNANGPGYSFFDKSNNLVYDSNPAVKQAFDTSLKFAENKLTANMSIFTPPWQTALKRDTFAALPCPSWMLGGIEEFSGDYGKGSGTSPRPRAAPAAGAAPGWPCPSRPSTRRPPPSWPVPDLPEGQVAAYKAANVFPSSPQAAQDPAVAGAKSEYFGDAPVGKIFGELAVGVAGLPRAQERGRARAVENVLISVGQGKQKPGDAWTKSVDEAKKAAR